MVLKNPLKSYTRALWKDGLLRKDEYSSICTTLAELRMGLFSNIISKAAYATSVKILEDGLNTKRDQPKPKRGLKVRNINVTRKKSRGKKKSK